MMPPKQQSVIGSPPLEHESTVSSVCGERIGHTYSIRGRTHNSSARFSMLPKSRQFTVRHLKSQLSDDIIVTPFAQILASLRNIRNNFMFLTDTQTSKPNRFGKLFSTQTIEEFKRFEEPPYTDMAIETLEELEWCLEQLETIHIQQPVSDMASNKFKQLLNKELSSISMKKRMSKHVSRYIKSFLDIDSCDKEADGVKYDDSSSSLKMIATPEKMSIAQSDPLEAQSTSPNSLSIAIPRYGVSTPHEYELGKIFKNGIDEWGINVFEIFDLSIKQPLVSISYTIFLQRNFIEKFKMTPVVLINYLLLAESHYPITNPYHNSIHAADVTQSTHVLLSAKVLENVFTDDEMLAAIYSCIIHDINHPGVSNQFLINSRDELAIMYNDSSVLENHHLAVAFKLLQEKNCNIFKNMPRKQWLSFRKLVIEIVLATDLSKHMTILADLKTMVETNRIFGSGILTSESDRLLTMQNMVHCADLSNPTKPLNLYRQWTDRITEEFFRQGDREKEMKLEISPMCDRNKVSVASGQVSFIDFIVFPLWETWAGLVHPDCQGVLENLEDNRDWYQSQIVNDD